MLPFRKLALGVALGLSALTLPSMAADVAAPSGTYALEPTHASLVWKVNHFGLSNYTARFTKFDVTLKLDMDQIENSSVTASIDPTSVKTDYPGGSAFDEEIARDGKFLNASSFPQIEFVSTRLEKTGEKTALIHGQMTMLGVSKPVTLEATLNGAMASHPYAKVPAIGFHAKGTVKRSEFGFDHLIPYVGDDVQFVIEAEFLKAD